MMNLFIACLQETGDFRGRSGDERERVEERLGDLGWARKGIKGKVTFGGIPGTG